jgi:hypothetical protein
MVELQNLYYKDFDNRNLKCPIVFSRPQDNEVGGNGCLCDNSKQSVFCRPGHDEICDGIATGYGPDRFYDRQFWADSIWFERTIRGIDLRGRLSRDDFRVGSRLVMYIIAAGSVPRVRINGIWLITSPIYFPPYGDPYGFVFNGFKKVFELSGERLIFNIGDEDINEIIVEHIAPHGNNLGAQVVFVLEHDEV